MKNLYLQKNYNQLLSLLVLHLFSPAFVIMWIEIETIYYYTFLNSTLKEQNC